MPDLTHKPGCSIADPIKVCTCGLFLSLVVDGGSDTMTKEQDLHWARLRAINLVYAAVAPMNRPKPNLEDLWHEGAKCEKS